MLFLYAFSNQFAKILILNSISGAGSSRNTSMFIFVQSFVTYGDDKVWAWPKGFEPSYEVSTSHVYIKDLINTEFIC